LSVPTDPTAADWFAAARENLADAQLLATAQSWRNAYGLAGQALECALKGVIMQRLGLNRWPSRSERPDLYTHDLSDFADLAGLRSVLETAVANGDVVGVAWMVTKDHAINRRYPTAKPFPINLGKDMVQAVGRDGLPELLIAPKPR
jgi:HEPN domain-containing protein